MEDHRFPSSSPSPFELATGPSRSLDDGGKQEIRLYGLAQHHTTPALIAFFSQTATVHGVLLHPSSDGKQWAQLWVRGEEEAERCMEARAQLGASGVTMSRVAPQAQPAPSHTPLPPRFSSNPTPTPPSALSSFPPLYGPLTMTAPPHQRSDSRAMSELSIHRQSDMALSGPSRLHYPGMGHRHLDAPSLPRNLYIVDLPLDMTEIQFRAMFERHGYVEHCKLLSQLDGNGRRRGFILMSSHREALEAMRSMNGLMMDGARLDVSWALVQREAKHFGAGTGAMPNRVIHPPVHPLRRELAPASIANSAVIVEGLDPQSFPTANIIRELFSTFGPIKQVSLLNTDQSNALAALIEFESAFSAELLVQASGMVIGSQRVHVRYLQQPTQPLGPHQPFRQEDPGMLQYQQPRSRLGGNAILPPDPFPPRPTHHQPVFNPFSLDASFDDNTGYDLEAKAMTDQLAHSRLNAASSPFVPSYAFSRTHQGATYMQQQDQPHRHSSEPKTPSPPPLFTSNLPIQPQPKSSPSTGHSSDTIVSTSSSGGKSTQHGGSRSGKASVGKSVPAGMDVSVEDEIAVDTTTPTKVLALGAIGSGRKGDIGAGIGAGVTSRMHERWLRAGMGKAGEEKWFKGAAWCEFASFFWRVIIGLEADPPEPITTNRQLLLTPSALPPPHSSLCILPPSLTTRRSIRPERL